MSIHREEVYSKIQEENRLASSWNNVDMGSLKDLMGGMGKKP
jgi:sRNA-binding carbon storage regulator CsrA